MGNRENMVGASEQETEVGVKWVDLLRSELRRLNPGVFEEEGQILRHGEFSVALSLTKRGRIEPNCSADRIEEEVLKVTLHPDDDFEYNLPEYLVNSGKRLSVVQVKEKRSPSIR